MVEVQIDRIVGPTHYYGGLSYGNVASMMSRLQPSNPKQAALEGLEKMKLVHDLGCQQFILPPQNRPVISALKTLGFSGSEQQILEQAYKMAPELLMQCSSQSAMWTANAATVTPSSDTADKKVHITPANLITNLHRSLEADDTAAILKQLFPSSRHFVHHDALPCCQEYADEGAANHTRFTVGDKSLHLFVYGRDDTSGSSLFPARQTLKACQAIQRRHGIDRDKVLFVQQNPKVIDKGVFHNDVIAVGHESLFFVHELAYTDTDKLLQALLDKLPLNIVKVQTKELSVEQAVSSYLFNSQFLTLPDGQVAILCPTEVDESNAAKRIVEKRLPVDKVFYLPLNQSMKNGGGPACLRLRVPLTKQELKTVLPSAQFSDALYSKLVALISKYYPEKYTPKMVLDSSFRKQCSQAVASIKNLLNLNYV